MQNGVSSGVTTLSRRGRDSLYNDLHGESKTTDPGENEGFQAIRELRSHHCPCADRAKVLKNRIGADSDPKTKINEETIPSSIALLEGLGHRTKKLKRDISLHQEDAAFMGDSPTKLQNRNICKWGVKI